MNLKNYTFSFGAHNGSDVIWIHFPNLNQLKIDLKNSFPSAKWSNTNKAWYLPDRKSVRAVLLLPEKNSDDKLMLQLSEENRLAFKKYRQQLTLKAYSDNTVNSYKREFFLFLKTLKNVSAHTLSQDRLKDYFLYVIKKDKVKEQTINAKINAIKFYYEKVLHQPKMFFDIPRPKSPLSLPKTLTKKEISKLFSVIKNQKHLLILKLCYGMGLRVSEIVQVKIEHIDSENMRVLIANAKGKKDRYTNLPESILEDLRAYYVAYLPKEYLFEGEYGGQYSTRSVQLIFKNAMRKANINKSIGIHGLRHSYATHLIEAGADIRFIKDLLGHSSITTTQIYTQVTDAALSKIKSPLDSF